MANMSDRYLDEALNNRRTKWNVSSAESVRPFGTPIDQRVNDLEKQRLSDLGNIYSNAQQLRDSEQRSQLIKDELARKQQSFELDEKIRSYALERSKSMDEKNLQEKDLLLKKNKGIVESELEDIQRNKGVKNVEAKVKQGRFESQLQLLDTELENTKKDYEITSLEKDFAKAVQKYQIKNLPDAESTKKMQREIEQAGLEKDLQRAINATKEVSKDISLENIIKDKSRESTSRQLKEAEKIEQLREKLIQGKLHRFVPKAINFIVRAIPGANLFVDEMQNDPNLYSPDVNTRVQTAQKYLQKANIPPTIPRIKALFGDDFVFDYNEAPQLTDETYNELNTELNVE